MRRLILVLLALLPLAACDEPEVADFADHSPKLDFIDYFTGEVHAWGLFTDRFGTVRRQFTVVMNGRVENEKLVLTEDFTYDDGETEQRVWTVERANDGYVATAPDVVGAAVGERAGNAVRFRYELNLPVDDDVWTVTADDWIYLQPGAEVALNQATFSYWGIEVGRVNIAFRKVTN
ncbi:MAG: DUF3833 domain-containing protein [Alphaproteobacteria bacterium]